MPFKDNEREYRNFASFNVETRSEDNEEKKIVEGYASTFEEYVLRDFGDEIWTERIEPTAFDNTDFSDVVFLRDHEGTVFARTKNNTLSIIPDSKGLFTKTNLGKTTSARNMFEEIEAGLYTQMSFAMTVGDQRFEEEERDGKRIIHRIIQSVKKCFDVSAVCRPANPTTEIGVATREVFDGAIEELRAERQRVEKAKREEARKKLALKLKLEELEK